MIPVAGPASIRYEESDEAKNERIRNQNIARNSIELALNLIQQTKVSEGMLLLRAVSLSPDAPQNLQGVALNKLGILYSFGVEGILRSDPMKGRMFFLEAATKQNLDATHHLADLAKAEGRKEQCRNWLTIAANYHCPRAEFQLGQMAEEDGKPEEAYDCYLRAFRYLVDKGLYEGLVDKQAQSRLELLAAQIRLKILATQIRSLSQGLMKD